MTVFLRSRLFRIAMLSFAVLFSQTANAAKPVRQFSVGARPSSLKLCAAWPESRKNFTSAIKKIRRPSAVPAIHPSFSVAGLISSGAVNLQASRQATVVFNLQWLTYAAPQSRPVVLRI
jgi:hypothetical protein